MDDTKTHLMAQKLDPAREVMVAAVTRLTMEIIVPLVVQLQDDHHLIHLVQKCQEVHLLKTPLQGVQNSLSNNKSG